ncbi:MAG: diaminopimelate epimerase, partial [Acidimicrobiales bacterium]|nr:diaminopimelate epimerase [Acidimicrobiales bacterium]
HHCLGNDFLVVLDELNGPVTIGPVDARRLCDRHRGSGGDGLLHGPVASREAGQGAEPGDVVMHLFNADGSRAELSGNGIRCFGQAVADARGIQTGELRVGTDAGVKRLRLWPGASQAETEVAAEIGTAAPGPELPRRVKELLGEWRCTTVDLGNPHLVVLLDGLPKLRDLELASTGPQLEREFPGGINIEFVAVIGPTTIELRVWERGVGITEACGTGACAVASQLAAWGYTGDDVEVRMPGGAVNVTIDEQRRITLIGPSVRVASIEVDDA